MNELSLFTGAGGGVLGSKLLGHRIIGYVEINDYRQRIIAQRIKDDIFDEAPIFGDIRAFNREGYAASYSGMVDLISGGFPCQDLSCAGKGAGLDGEKSGLWFEMATTIRIVRPCYVFIENVPALLVRGFDRVLGSLSQMGYDATWGIVSAADVGAPHLRERIWILAHSNQDKRQTWNRQQGEQREAAACSSCCNDSDTEIECQWAGLCTNQQGEVGRRRSCDVFCQVSDTVECAEQQGVSQPTFGTIPGENEADNGWWKSEPAVGRKVDGLAS